MMEGYKFSLGYYFKVGEEEKGTYLELDHGHDSAERKKKAEDNNVEYDYCLFFYTHDKENKASMVSNFGNGEILGVNRDETESFVFSGPPHKILKSHVKICSLDSFPFNK